MATSSSKALPRMVIVQIAIAVIAMVVIIAVLWGIGPLLKQRADLQENISNKKLELTKLEEKIELANAKLQQNEYGLAKEVLQDQKPRLTSTRLPRVYVHVASPEQQTIARSVTTALLNLGFTVPKEEILVDARKNSTDVRYFYEQDKSVAEKIAQTLGQQFHIANVKVIDLSGKYKLSPGHFEIWFATDVK